MPFGSAVKSTPDGQVMENQEDSIDSSKSSDFERDLREIENMQREERQRELEIR